MCGAVLLRRQSMCFEGVQAKVGEAVATLIAQQTLGVLVEDAVAAVAVLITDPHPYIVSRSCAGVQGLSRRRRVFGVMGQEPAWRRAAGCPVRGGHPTVPRRLWR